MKLHAYLSSILFTVTWSYPVGQPVYPNTQYITAQAIPAGALQYRQQQPQAYVQPSYITAQQTQTAKPVHEAERVLGLQKYSTQIKQPIQQVLVSTNVDRQVQRVAQSGGPFYLQQVQAAQQQGQAQQLFDTAQRKVTSQSLNRQIQPLPIQLPIAQHQSVPQPQPQPHYLRALPQQQTQVTYVPGAPGYRSGAQARPQQEAKDQQNPEDYDPNPSYQFGFDVNDDLYTNYQNRKEQREGNKITGSYSVVDSDGFVRTVTYTADPKEGFKAEVTRQPTDIVVKIPKPDPQYQRQPQQYLQASPEQQKGQEQAQRSNLIQYQYQ